MVTPLKPLALALFLALATALCPAEPPFLAGVAKRLITPEVGEGKPTVWLAGYGAGRAATGVHDDLFARALVLKLGETTVAFVTLDLIGFFHPEVVQIRATLAAQCPISHLIVASTHNHEGPDTLGLWGEHQLSSGVNPAYNALVRQKVCEAVLEAAQTLKPVRVRFTQSATKGITTDSRPPKVLDEGLYLMHFEHADSGKPFATFVNWSAHPEVLGSRNTLVTADFCKYVVDRLEREFGAGYTALYFTGSIGGLLGASGKGLTDPATGKPPPNATFREAELVGEEVAHVAIEAIRSAPLSQPNSISFKVKEIYVPLTNAWYWAGRAAGVVDRKLYAPNPDGKTFSEEGVGARFIRSEASVVTLGDAQFLAVPGEIYPELTNGGIQTPQDPGADFQGAPAEPPLRSLMTGKFRFVLGLANDELGYIIPKSQWDSAPPYTYGREKPLYGEINSASYELAPTIADAFRQLLTSAP
ncbi:MAG: hypothetical protein FJ272_21260 [Planctomycetes bacterium]|nr:hypothetical protein [Planctomycetota bacterium]